MGHSAVEQSADVGADEQVESAVEIVIAPGAGERGPPTGNAARDAYIRERAVAVIAPKLDHAAEETGATHGEAGIAAILVIAGGDSEPVGAAIKTAFDTDVGKGAVEIGRASCRERVYGPV